MPSTLLSPGTTDASPRPTVRMVVMFAVSEGPDAGQRALQAATPGYLLEGDDPAALMETIRRIHQEEEVVPSGLARRVMLHVTEADRVALPDQVPLSPREKEVLGALVEGLSYKMIADQLTISFETVRSHIKRIYEKLQVHNNTEAVAKTLRYGLLA